MDRGGGGELTSGLTNRRLWWGGLIRFQELLTFSILPVIVRGQESDPELDKNQDWIRTVFGCSFFLILCDWCLKDVIASSPEKRAEGSSLKEALSLFPNWI